VPLVEKNGVLRVRRRLEIMKGGDGAEGHEGETETLYLRARGRVKMLVTHKPVPHANESREHLALNVP
jgi:hypothetical protein